MDAFPNAAQCQLCLDCLNSLISLYCSGDTLVIMGFPKDPGISASLSLRYLYAVLGFFQNARCITVERSSPASARAIVPPNLKDCMASAVRSSALRACTFSAFVTSGADMEVSPLMGVPVFGRWEILGKRYPFVMFQPSAIPTAMCSPYCDVLLDCSYGARGHTLIVVLYGHQMIGAISHRLSPLEIKGEAAFIW